MSTYYYIIYVIEIKMLNFNIKKQKENTWQNVIFLQEVEKVSRKNYQKWN